MSNLPTVREVIEFSDNDSDIVRRMKTELQIVYGMKPEERQVFYQEQSLADEERQLQWMIDSNKSDDESAAFFVERAKYYVESDIEIAELYTEMARSTKRNKFSIADIRKQREKIQWQKNQLKKSVEKSSELTQSSSLSKT